MANNEEKKSSRTKAKNPLAAVAEVIGAAAGTVASTLKVHPHADHKTSEAVSTPAPAHGKLPKKNKSRLPRRQKKALKQKQQKAAAK